VTVTDQQLTDIDEIPIRATANETININLKYVHTILSYYSQCSHINPEKKAIGFNLKKPARSYLALVLKEKPDKRVNHPCITPRQSLNFSTRAVNADYVEKEKKCPNNTVID